MSYSAPVASNVVLDFGGKPTYVPPAASNVIIDFAGVVALPFLFFLDTTIGA
jgi:hypothetical protein